MIWKSYLVLQLALLTHLSRAKMENNKVQNVVGASVFRRGQMVKEGSLVRLTCHTERPWFFCLWQSPGEDRQCAINFQEMDPETVCKGKRLALQGTEEACNLQIEAEPSDHGAWMCLVTYDDDFDTSKVFIDLEVAVKASLIIYVDEAQKEEDSMIQQSVLHKRSSVDSDIVESEDEDNVIHIDEGEVKSVTCSAMKAFPRSQLSWTLNNSTSSDLDDTSQALIKFYKDNHWMDTTQSVKLVGDMEHNNSTLACWAQQVNRTGHLVFLQSSSARINVHPVGAPLILTRTSESIGLLILIILLLLIVTFLCIILAIPTCRKRKRRRKQEEQRQALQNGGHVSNGSRGYVPNESSRRRASYDQNRNKLRIKREPFRDSILKAEELLDQAFEDTGDDPVVIVSDAKTSSVTFSEMGTEISGPKYSMAGSQNNAPKFPSRAESQTSSHNSILKTDSVRSPPYPALRGESQLSPSKSSSRASLSISPLNAAASRLPDGDLFDTSVPVDQISFDDPIAPPDQISFANAAPDQISFDDHPIPNDQISFDDHPLPNDQISFDDYAAPNDHISFDDPPAPIDRISLEGSPPPLEHIKLVEAVDASDDGSVDDAIARDHDNADTLPMSVHDHHDPEAKDSVFFCREGCFNLSSPCTHIRVAIPRSTNV